MPKEQVQEERIAFTVKRSEWLNANRVSLSNTKSCLYNSKINRKCCMGFLCLSLGWGLSDIAGINYPSYLDFFNPDSIQRRVQIILADSYIQSGDINIPLESQIARINDDVTLTEGEREFQLTELFKEHGFDVTFVD